MNDALAAFDLASAHTLAVIGAVQGDAAWDHSLGAGVPTLRGQLLHVALVRESILRQLTGEATTGLGRTFEDPAWQRGGTKALTEAFQAHTTRCRDLLERVAPETSDAPFTTPFGNRSTRRNYLRMLLLEETHHRAQMTLLLRLNGFQPPDYPGRAWVELGVPQG